MTKPDPTNTTLELRRGATILAVLSQLGEEHYGYSLREKLAANGFPIPEGTLYPLLRRLESAGLLESTWRVVDGRPRRYYQASDEGKRMLENMTTEWKALVESINGLLESK